MKDRKKGGGGGGGGGKRKEEEKGKTNTIKRRINKIKEF